MPSPYACPECHGVLRELREGGRMRFRCHTGHAYTAESLLREVGHIAEASLWSAVRSFEEGERLLRGLALRVAETPGADPTELLRRADELKRRATAVRGVILEPAPVTTAAP